MAVSTRIKNNAGVFFSLKKGASAAVVFDDLKTYELTPEPKDDSDLTFSEAAAGTGVDWTFSGTAVTSFDSASLHTYLWTNAGSEVTVVLGAAGNTTASSTQPHLTFTAKIPLKPGVAGEAGTDGTGQEFDFELEGTSDVTKVTA